MSEPSADGPRTVILDIPLDRPAVRPDPRPAPEPPPEPDAPAPHTPGPDAVQARPITYADEPTVLWGPVTRPARTSAPRQTHRHLAVGAVAVPVVGLAGVLAGLMSSLTPVVVAGWGIAGGLLLPLLIRVVQRIADAIAGVTR